MLDVGGQDKGVDSFKEVREIDPGGGRKQERRRMGWAQAKAGGGGDTSCPGKDRVGGPFFPLKP